MQKRSALQAWCYQVRRRFNRDVHIAPFGVGPAEASCWSAVREVNVKRETELILASASPRKPG